MKRFGRRALLLAVSLFLVGCLPLGAIQDKIGDGKGDVGPSWPITVTFPIMKDREIELGADLDGFKGGRLGVELFAFERELGGRGLDFDIDQRVKMECPGGVCGDLSFPIDQFDTDVEIENVVQATLDAASGGLVVRLDGLSSAPDDEVTLSLWEKGGDVIASVEIPAGATEGTLSLGGKTLVPNMELKAGGKLRFDSGVSEAFIEIKSEGSFKLAEAVLKPAHVSSRFDGGDPLNVAERIQLPADLQLDILELDITADVDFSDFSAANLSLSVDVELFGYDELGGTVLSIPGTVTLAEGTTHLDELAEAFADMIIHPDVREVEIAADAVSVGAEDPGDDVTLTFSGAPKLAAAVKLTLGGADGDAPALGFSTVFDVPEGIPAGLEGGSVRFTVDNPSVKGRLNMWLAEASATDPAGDAHIAIHLDGHSAEQTIDAVIDKDVLALFHDHDELRAFVRVSAVEAAPDSKLVISARGTITGRVNAR